MEVLADSKIRKYERGAYLSVVRHNSKWQNRLHVVSLHVFKYSHYVHVYPASRVSTGMYTSTCTCMYI